MHELLLGAPAIGAHEPERRSRTRSEEEYEPLWLEENGVIRKALLPRAAGALLIEILDGANGKRLIAASPKAVAGKLHMSLRTVQRYFELLQRTNLLVPVEENTVLRRIRLNYAPDDYHATFLRPKARLLLQLLTDRARGQKTFTMSSRHPSLREHFAGTLYPQNLNYLIERGAITQQTPASARLNVYRLDVKRRSGRGLHVTVLSPELTERDATYLQFTDGSGPIAASA